MTGSSTRRHGEGTYQMLWDCRFCGTEKLLGVTHRHCPNCGAAQDPEWRYMPAEEDMVALEDHQYVGADKICPACQQPNSAASAFCIACGADLSEAPTAPLMAARDIGSGHAESDTRRDVVKAHFAAEMARVEAEAPAPAWFGFPRKLWAIAGGLALLAVIVAGVVYALNYRKATTGEITGAAWERTIEIEVFDSVNGQNWDDSVPADAYNKTCDRRERRKEQVQVDTRQECRDVDQGDGSFRRQCNDVPVYEERPVYDQWCTYSVDRWEFSRNVKAGAEGYDAAPYWPDYALALGSGAKQYGAERAGRQHETYRVTVRDKDGKQHTCELESLEEWQQFRTGTPVTLKLYINGGADCDSLALAN